MAKPCEHLEHISLDPMPEGGCEDCIAIGDAWVHLRYCVICGHTGCCNDSKNQHATRHWESTHHGVIRSKEPGEHWAYCYADDVATDTDRL